MKVSLVVKEGPYTHQASDSAYQFARACIDRGHEIYRVFFYHDGVYNGSKLTVPPQDERDVVERWSALGEQHALDLVLCVAAAQRRGLLDSEEARRHGKDSDNCAPGFRIGGLGQLIDAAIRSDRLLEFGD